jgi:excisionase family DNA binding protein
MKLLTYKAAAEVLDMSPRFVQERVSRGEIPIVRLGNEVRILAEDLEIWVRKHRGENCGDRKHAQPCTTRHGENGSD